MTKKRASKQNVQPAQKLRKAKQSYIRPWLAEADSRINELLALTLMISHQHKAMIAHTTAISKQIKRANTNKLATKLRESFTSHGHVATESDEPILLRVYDHALVETGANINEASIMVMRWIRELPSGSTANDLLRHTGIVA